MKKSGAISTGNHSAEKVGTGRWVQSSCKLANTAGAPTQWESLSQYKVESILRNDTWGPPVVSTRMPTHVHKCVTHLYSVCMCIPKSLKQNNIDFRILHLVYLIFPFIQQHKRKQHTFHVKQNLALHWGILVFLLYVQLIRLNADSRNSVNVCIAQVVVTWGCSAWPSQEMEGH